MRSNYGTGILPTMFGAELYLMDPEIDTLPTAIPLGGIASMHLEDSLRGVDESKAAHAVKALLDRGIPDMHTALGGKVLEMADYYPGNVYTLSQNPDVCPPLPSGFAGSNGYL